MPAPRSRRIRAAGRAGVVAVGLGLALPVAGAGASAGPVLEYRLDENGGPWAGDTSGNGLDAPIETTPDYTAPAWGPGHTGSALVFDGTGDVLNVGDDDLLDLDDYTLMAWVHYEETSQSRQEVLEKVDSYWMNIRRTTRRLRAGGFYGGCSSSSWVFHDSDWPVAENTWTHVASSYDGATLRIYLDGQAAGSLSVSGSVCANANPLAIGAKYSPSQGIVTAFFNGTIDDVRLYDRALAPSEIRRIVRPRVPALATPARLLLVAALLAAAGAAAAQRGSAPSSSTGSRSGRESRS